MLSFFVRLKNAALYPAAFLIVSAQSARARFRAMGKAPVIHFEAPYDGRRIMLLALYEKGELRPDVIRLLRAAKAEGLYILAVNTLKLREPARVNDLIDCYIERPNFGRDFGSYQTGFLHVFERGWDATCPRLLLINDSIFFTEERMPRFLHDMMASETEALGSTENYEIEHHLGSFCIAMAGSVLRHAIFRKYWKKYKLTDVRPLVILRGEMKLTKTLKKCVSKAGEFKALYGAAGYSARLQSNPMLIDEAIRIGRTSDLTGWRRVGAKTLLTVLQSRFLVPLHDVGDNNTQVEIQINELDRNVFIAGYEDLQVYIREKLIDSSSYDEDMAMQAIHAALVEIYMSGSQIHQNAALLIKMGLPIIKLDGLYRGMFNIFDINMICDQIAPGEAAEVRNILMERPYGGDTLKGWKNAAFMRGLI